MNYFASADFATALKAVAVLYQNEKGNLSQEEEKMIFEIMNNLLLAYSAYWKRQQGEVAEDMINKVMNEGRLSQEEAKFLRKTIRGHLA